jgi:hypothetical protein
LAKVNRVVIAEGECHVVEYAVCADLSVPARRFLEDMARGEWRDDPAADGFPDDAQVSHYDKLLAMIELMAESGLPMYQRAVNDLEDGIWEFKIGAARLTYYDTDGQGGYVAKLRVGDLSDSAYPDDEFWWYPTMDATLRLGHAFPKTGETTSTTDLDESERVRKEDLGHD